MNADHSQGSPAPVPLLGEGDPGPVIVTNPAGRSPFLLLGDHAGNGVPRRLGTLGLSAIDRTRHIAWDIGVRALGECLSARLDAVFVHQHYSRLVIDCNRAPDRADACPVESDGTPVPANRRLTDAERTARIAEIHEPYQQAIAREIERRAEAGQPIAIVALHSFTRRLGGAIRPWSIGVLHDGRNDRFARALLAELRSEAPTLEIGDNEPYRMDETDHTVARHAFGRDLPYVELELAQDELDMTATLLDRCRALARLLRSAASRSGNAW